MEAEKTHLLKEVGTQTCPPTETWEATNRKGEEGNMQPSQEGKLGDREAREDARSPRPEEQSAALATWLGDEPITMFPPPTALTRPCVFPPSHGTHTSLCLSPSHGSFWSVCVSPSHSTHIPLCLSPSKCLAPSLWSPVQWRFSFILQFLQFLYRHSPLQPFSLREGYFISQTGLCCSYWGGH